jgi:hypothetical protein
VVDEQYGRRRQFRGRFLTVRTGWVVRSSGPGVRLRWAGPGGLLVIPSPRQERHDGVRGVLAVHAERDRGVLGVEVIDELGQRSLAASCWVVPAESRLQIS